MTFSLFVHLLALLFSFFIAGTLLGALFSKPLRNKLANLLGLHLNKSTLNPILTPGTRPWTAEAVLNPAAIVLGGRTHMVYRAIGMDGVSRLGYASSPDGTVFDEQLPYPAYIARNPSSIKLSHQIYSPVLYPSGGSWGGCEDPRMVTIEGRVYVTFNMFDNWTLRVAVMSLSAEDFLAKKFTNWDGPIILSHGTRDKNWVLFPEKIQGQFAILHSIIGDTDDTVRIEYVSNLTDLAKRNFESPDPQKITDHQVAWHMHTRSAGPPPIKTNKGWLVLYHANDAHEPNKYKLGALLLDLTDPTKILYRAQVPVLTPDETYENNGKPGIVYACGATVKNDILSVYYGGADKVTCVATAPLESFLDALIKGTEDTRTILKIEQTA